MSTIALPQSTLASLDQMSRSFLWGSTNEKRKIHLVAWERVCMPKGEGGLGVRSAKSMNKALLAKLGWRMFQDSGGLWSRILKHKYKVGSLKDQTWLTPKGSWSSTWRSISAGIREVVIPGLRWVINDGRSTLFWRDRWLINRPLAEVVVTPIPPHLLEVSVSDMWRPETGWELMNIAPYVTNEVSLILQSRIVDSFTTKPDCLSWNPSSDGCFTVKSAYEEITYNHQPRQLMGNFFSKVWCAAVPERIRVFFWLVSNQVLMTNALRHQRHLSDSRICPVCRGADETILHILRDCPAMAGIWQRLVPHHRLQSFRELSLLEWIYTNLGDSRVTQNCPWEITFCVAAWWGWKWRCDAVFNNAGQCRDRVKFIRDLAMEIWQAYEISREGRLAVERVQRLIAWSPPAVGWFKLNTDGASHGNPGLATAGGVIRDGSGSWCGGFAFNIGICSAPLAELWGVFYGLNMAWTQGITQVEVEVDSEIVVGFLKTGIPDSHPLSLLVHLCYGLLSKDWMVRISHVYREANRLADGLANYAFTLPLGIHQISHCPEELNYILVDDANGTALPRLVRV